MAEKKMKIIRLADIEPVETVKIKDGTFLCSECGKPADAFHYSYNAKKWKAGCPDHEPGEYWLRIEDLISCFGEWLGELCFYNRLQSFFEFLGDEGIYSLRNQIEANIEKRISNR